MKKEKQEIGEQLDLMKRREKELELKMIKFSSHEDNQIKTLKFLAKTNVQMQSAYFSKMEEFSNLHPVAPLVLKASFEIQTSFHRHHSSMGSRGSGYHYTAKPYCSQSFYSHQNGYKLQLSAEIMCHCSDCRKPQKKVTTQHQPSCTYDDAWMQGDMYNGFGHMQQQPYNSDVSDYVSSYPRGYASLAVNLCILKGDNDSHLKWPFHEDITITMYHQENDYAYDYRGVATDRFVSGVQQSYIPHETATFEGNQNHTNTGKKLDIKSLTERNAKLLQSLQPASQVKQLHDTDMLQHQSYMQSSEDRQSRARDGHLQLQKDMKKAHEEKLRLYKEKGLLFSLDSFRNQGSQYGCWNRSGQPYDETVYCEVTFSPQPSS